MFSKWIEKREKKNIQRLCPHEYFDLNSDEKENFFRIYTVYNMYCPICDSQITVLPKESERILAKQKVRNRYESIN